MRRLPSPPGRHAPHALALIALLAAASPVEAAVVRSEACGAESRPARPAAPPPPDPASRTSARAAEAPVRALPDAWARLTDHAGLKVGAFFLGVSLIRIASSRDQAVRDWAQRTQVLGEASALGAQSPPLILGGTALTIAGLALFADDASDSARQWKHLEIFAVSQAVTSGLTDLLKVATWRERPDGGNHLSFPSGHTSSAFAWATFVWRRYGWQWGLPAYVFAAFVGFSRIHDDRHWLSDVLAGALLGVSVTYVVDELYGPLD